MKDKNKIRILARSIYGVIAAVGSARSQEVIANFLLYLKKHRSEHLIPSLLEELELLYFSNQGIAKVEVSAKDTLASETLEQIAKIMQKRLDKKINIKSAVDVNILGGLKIRYQDKMIDMTLDRRLQDLSQQLNH